MAGHRCSANSKPESRRLAVMLSLARPTSPSARTATSRYRKRPTMGQPAPSRAQQGCCLRCGASLERVAMIHRTWQPARVAGRSVRTGRSQQARSKPAQPPSSAAPSPSSQDENSPPVPNLAVHRGGNCHQCDSSIPSHRRSDARYCTDDCKDVARKLRRARRSRPCS